MGAATDRCWNGLLLPANLTPCDAGWQVLAFAIARELNGDNFYRYLALLGRRATAEDEIQTIILLSCSCPAPPAAPVAATVICRCARCRWRDELWQG